VNKTLRRLRHARPIQALVLTAAAAVTTLALVAPSSAIASGSVSPDVKAPPANPTRASQIQNIDQVKTAIKAYYGDTAVNSTDPVTQQPTTLHFASAGSSYAVEMAGIEAKVGHFLKSHRPHSNSSPEAIVLDVDDTTLNTYSYEIYSNFVFNPTSNAAFVNSGIFPAVFGMPALAAQAKAEGYTIFFLTGRPESQRTATAGNLVNVGYPSVPAGQLFLKDQTNQPWLASCSPSCTTIQYKSLTRQHIESLGYDIVANLGDQFSDLSGGFADQTYKLPNPMYFLP
jgi:predicted secreted acid phosphatase